MNPSDLVLEFLADPITEGCKLAVYRDSHQLLTVGIGHLLTKSELMSGKILIGGLWVQYKTGITVNQAYTLCRQDISTAAGAIRNYVAVDLEQCQYDALCCFVFNIGTAAFAGSTLLSLLNQGQYDQVPVQMRRWDHVGGIESGVLKARREREILVWLGKWPVVVEPALSQCRATRPASEPK